MEDVRDFLDRAQQEYYKLMETAEKSASESEKIIDDIDKGKINLQSKNQVKEVKRTLKNLLRNQCSKDNLQKMQKKTTKNLFSQLILNGTNSKSLNKVYSCRPS